MAECTAMRKIHYFKLKNKEFECVLYHFELLFDIFDDCLTVKANKGSTDQFWMNWMSTNHLARYLKK